MKAKGHAGVVRIIGGQWKRSKLPVGHAPGLRPTPDRVRETLFNWLGQDLDGWRCLDAFAGSGALGFEAASRGAARVVMLERDRRRVESLEQTRLRLQATQVRVEQAEALGWLARCPPASFELIFIDPPYEAGLQRMTLEAAAPALVPGGYAYVEAPAPPSAEGPGAAPMAPSGWTVHRQGRAGAVQFFLLQRAGEA